MKFSVIVPAYNAMNRIDHCIHSLLAQKETDYELIIVDDGSTDRTPSILDGLRELRIEN